PLHDRRKDELPERAAGVDKTSGKGTPLRRQALHHRADQDREARRPRAGRAEDSERGDQFAFRVHKGDRRGAEGEQYGAEHDDASRAKAVGDRAEKGLRRAPHELTDRDGEADPDDAEPRRFIERRNKEADRLSSAGGDREDRGGGER